ncbi:MAG: 3-oxoacyl-ACP reductase FabG [Rickettsiaceae bacterium]|nr:3-oxoacyl-ACP reductase FabG [Rickettsiaceae bacterium]
MIDLSNNTALITGASRGIGKAIAKKLHELGAHVIITGTNLDKLNELSSELGGNNTVYQANLKNKDECKNLIEKFDNIDILVCNAGITKDGLSIRMSDEAFEEVIQVNLTSNFILIRGAIKNMMKKRYGRIITMSSIVGFTGNAGQVNYTSSKAGLVAMTKSFAKEVASRNITVNSVAPGFILSEMTDQLNEDQKNAVLEHIPMKAFGTPEDIANTVAFLASPQARYITGSTIHVNGGMAMI